YGDEREHEKVVEPLHLRLLGRGVRGAEQARRADEREIPADAERDQRRVEVMQVDAGERDRTAEPEQAEPDADDRQLTEACDHAAGEEGRREHSAMTRIARSARSSPAACQNCRRARTFIVSQISGMRRRARSRVSWVLASSWRTASSRSRVMGKSSLIGTCPPSAHGGTSG